MGISLAILLWDSHFLLLIAVAIWLLIKKKIC